MSYTIPAGNINILTKTLQVWGAGLASFQPGGGATLTIKVKIAGVTLVSWTTSSIANVTNAPFNFTCYLSVVSTGATATIESHGFMNYKTTAGAGTSVINIDANAAVSSSIDLTSAQTLQITATYNNGNAADSATQRQMVIEYI